MIINRKGVSAVVANVLIILLVLAAIAIIWAVIRPTIESAGEQINSECFSLLINSKSCKIYNGDFCVGGFNDGNSCGGNQDCINGNNDGICTALNEVRVGVHRNPGIGELTDIRFVFGGSSSGVLSANDDDTSGALFPNELETSNFVFSLADISGLVSGDTVDIAAVVGAQEVLCNPSGSPVVCN